jgi:peptidoglycan hydrolase-like protein with peptidoglycan-binding domain
MWCGIGKSNIVIAATCLITASLVISDAALGVRARNYTPQQFRSVLRGLGYNVKVTNAPLTDAETKKAIREFQQGYKLGADGVAGAKTYDFAASIVQILQANLNVVAKPKPPLPRDQFYGPRVEAAVKQAQKQLQLQETGIADLAFRQKLNEEAKKAIGGQATPEPTTSPSPSPSPKPKPTPTPTPRAKPTATPTAKPTATPEATPEATPSPTGTPEATPTPTETPTPTPTPTKTP